MAVYKLVPHEIFPEVPRMRLPTHNLHIEDPEWYDGIGNDQIEQLCIWDMDSNEDRVEAFSQLLSEHPSRGLSTMFSAAAEGNAHIMRFLLGKGVKGTAVKADGDDISLVPLHAAAYQGHIECVKMLTEEAGVDVDTVDDTGGTPLMRACWGKKTLIVRYLLERGADPMIRQSKEGPNAFEFACGSGCVECAELIAIHARHLGLWASGPLATALALEAAVSSSEITMLELFLNIAEYSHKHNESGSIDTISFPNQTMKDAFENGFRRLLRRSPSKSFRKFFAYIESHGEDGEYNWASLKKDTLDEFEKAIFEFAEAQGDDKDNDALSLVLDIVLGPSSRFARDGLLDQKDLILSNCWFWAAQNNNMGTIQLLDSCYPDLDINHLTTSVEPAGAHHTLTSGSGDDEIIKYIPILTAHPYMLDIHLGTREQINAPTPLWSAIRKVDSRRVRLLLENGGPVDRIDEMARPTADEDEKSKIVVTAALAFRTPVKVEAPAQWAKEGNVQLEVLAEKGEYLDKEGNNVKYVVLELGQSDLYWWDKLKLDES